jgi:hypothetical protein
LKTIQYKFTKIIPAFWLSHRNTQIEQHPSIVAIIQEYSDRTTSQHCGYHTGILR